MPLLSIITGSPKLKPCSDPPLVGFLLASGTWYASDPRNKLFEILGLAGEMRDPDICPQLAPDYSKSLLDLYPVAARHLLITNTNVLSAVRHFSDSPEEGFPSSVPRWDQQTRIPSLSNTFSANAWSTHGKPGPCIALPDNTYIILISGFYCDRMRDVDASLYYQVCWSLTD